MKRIKQTNAEMWGIWDYCLGSKSHLNLAGKIVFFPLWIVFAVFSWLQVFMFHKFPKD